MFIVGTIRSETAPKLAVHLQNCDSGYNIPEDANFIVNYGRQGMEDIAQVNAKVRGDKLYQLNVIKRAGILVPDIYPLTYGMDRFSFPRYMYPLLARKVKHSKGKDIIFLKTRGSWRRRQRRVATRHFIVKYVPKAEEFRVHVLGNEITGISKKVKYEGCLSPHPHVWSRDRGWIQVDYEGQYTERLKELGIKAIKALNLDFGAIDVMLGRNGLFYVLEVNTAPRLNRRRRRLYAQFFRKKYREWRNNNAT